MSSSTSPVSEPKMTLTPAPLVSGCAASTISCSARMIRPSPIRIWPKRPIWLDSRRMNSVTPRKMRREREPERSNENTSVISAVPTSAPSITARAGRGGDQPLTDKRRHHHRGGGAALDQAP